MRHTAQIVYNLELGDAWDAYGLVGDVVVCNYFMSGYAA